MAQRDVSREEIKDKLAAAEARTEVKITALNGKLDQVLTKIDGINSRFGEIRDDGRATRTNIWVAAGIIVAVIGVLYAAFPGIVDFGVKLGEIKHAQETSRTPPAKTP